MRIGSFIVEQLSEGFFEFDEDGSLTKIDPSSLQKREEEKPEDSLPEKHSVALGIDPLFIQTPDANIVVDPGLGWGLDKNSEHRDTSNVVTNLDIFGITPGQIDWVILTHLHSNTHSGSTSIPDVLTALRVFR